MIDIYAVCINYQLIVVFDGKELSNIFFVPCRRRHMAFPSAPECPAVVYNHNGVKGAGWLPSEMVYCQSLLHSSVDVKKVDKIIC